jgi:prepilin-type N-terminal cleavage/methylation domain-containing protein
VTNSPSARVRPNKGRLAGFTLLELLVVMVIIGLLAGFVAPRYFAQVGKSQVKVAKAQIDAYAVMAGLNGIAHPADGMVELAARLGREVRVTPACCSIALGEEVLALYGADTGIAIDVQRIIESERGGRRPLAQLARIPVVART